MKRVLLLFLFAGSLTAVSAQTSLAVEVGTRKLQSEEYVLDFYQDISKKWAFSSWNMYATESKTQSVFSNFLLNLNYVNYKLTDDVTISAGTRYERNISYDYSIFTPVAKIRWKLL